MLARWRNKYFSNDPSHAANFAKACHFFEWQIAKLAEDMRNIQATLAIPLYRISVMEPELAKPFPEVASAEAQAEPAAPPAAAAVPHAAEEPPSPMPEYSPVGAQFLMNDAELAHIYNQLPDTDYDPTPKAALPPRPPPTPLHLALTPATAAEYGGRAEAAPLPPTQPSPQLENSSAANNGDAAVIPDSLPPQDEPRTLPRRQATPVIIKILPKPHSPLPPTPVERGEKEKGSEARRGGETRSPSPAF